MPLLTRAYHEHRDNLTFHFWFCKLYTRVFFIIDGLCDDAMATPGLIA